MTTAVALILLLPAAQAGATSPLVPGVRVRVTARQPGVGQVTHVGSLRTFDSETLTMSREDGAAPVSLSRQNIIGLDISRGQKRRAGTGLLVGTTLGLSAVALMDAACGEDCDRKDSVTIGTIVGGAVLGTVVGAMMKTERWQSVRWAIGPRRTGSGAPMPAPSRGVALALSVRF